MCAEFEEDIVEKTRCEVQIFDPTLSKEQQQLIESNPHFKFHAYGLGPEGVRPNSFRLSTLPQALLHTLLWKTTADFPALCLGA